MVVRFWQEISPDLHKIGKSEILMISFPNKFAQYEKCNVKNLNIYCPTYLRYNQVLPLFMVVRFWA